MYEVPARLQCHVTNMYQLGLLLAAKLVVLRHAWALSDVIDVGRALEAWNFPVSAEKGGRFTIINIDTNTTRYSLRIHNTRGLHNTMCYLDNTKCSS